MPILNKADSMIQECIDNLSDDNINKGGEALQELAIYWNKAGLTMQSFLDMRIYIIEMSKKNTDAYFIDEKLKISERSLREKRTNTTIIIH